MIDKTAQHKKGAHPSSAPKTTPKTSTPSGRPPVGAPPRPSQPVKPLTPEQRAKVEQICGGLDMLQEDTSVPRNIRRGAEEAKKLLLTDTMALDVRKSSAIGILDELANDPNIPLHGRTLIWSIMSQLEPLA